MTVSHYLNAVALLDTTFPTPSAGPPVISSSSPYGTDLWGVSDMDPAGIETGGNLVLAQACARRLLTPHGTLVDDSNYGYDLGQFLDDDIGPADVAKIQSAIQQELLKDERVQSAVASITFSQATSVLTVSVKIGGSNGPFSFVLTVTNLAATLSLT